MFREIAILCYLLIFRSLFGFFNWFPQQTKTIFVVSFANNATNVINSVRKKTNEKIVVVNHKTNWAANNEENQLNIDLKGKNQFNVFKQLRFMYHLATSKKVFVDTYYGFLAVTPFREGTICVQIWHAAGAIKQFGLNDESVKHRPKAAKKRFQQVYDRFDKIVVGSDEMASIFSSSFGLSEERMLKTGIPRTDFFFDEQKKKSTKEKLVKKYPILKEKKVILYVPTYREGKLEEQSLPFDGEEMQEALGKDYVLLLKTHPAIKGTYKYASSSFIIDVSHYRNVNELLTVTDILITDYSSIPFEFSLLKKPMIFYAYDLEEYKEEKGIWGNYEEVVPGPIAKTTSEIIDLIQRNQFDQEKIELFSQKWNRYSDGKSSERLVHVLYKT